MIQKLIPKKNLILIIHATVLLNEIYTILDGLKNHPMEYDDQIVRQIIECVIVESKEQIRVIFAGGLEVTQSLI